MSITKEDLAEAILESGRKFDEAILRLTKKQEETDRLFKETDLQMKETDRLFKETGLQMKETDRKLKSVGIQLGNISTNNGVVAEEFFYNTLSSKPILGGVSYDFTDKNITRKKGQIEDEFDIVMINGKELALIEVKYKAHEKDLKRLVEKKYENFKILYPEYSTYNVHLGLASFSIYDDLKEQALENNVMVLQRKGDVVETFLPN